jgi:UPF0755 protein
MMHIKHTTKRMKKTVIVLFVLSGILLAVLLASLKYYRMFFGPNVVHLGEEPVELFIPSNPSYDEVLALITYSGALKDVKAFDRVARRKGYDRHTRGGRYLLREGMSNNDLVNKLRGGYQTAVKVTFNNIRTVDTLAGLLARGLEPDSIAFLEAFRNDSLLSTMGLSRETLLACIIPNTYEMWWTTTPEAFLKRMKQENRKFWNDERRQKAEAIGLTPDEVATLASIVDEETIKRDEKPRVAGLYLNRLKIGMRLQADPTIKFVLGDFTVNRILTKDLEIDSPYNTYLYAGLPPGPIRMPSVAGIEAVLDFEAHDYLYMCAREDFTGYHRFARTLQQHNVNAAKYRRALRQMRIYR